MEAQTIALWGVGIGSLFIATALLKVNFFETAKKQLYAELEKTMPETVAGLNSIKNQQNVPIDEFFENAVNYVSSWFGTPDFKPDETDADSEPATANTGGPTVADGGEQKPSTDVNTQKRPLTPKEVLGDKEGWD